MKKVVRTVWISVLSGLAFLAAGCSHRTSSKLEKQRLAQEKETIEGILYEKEMECLYGSPEIIRDNRQQIDDLNARLEAIESRINALNEPRKEQRRKLIQQRDSIQAILQQREGAAVYGSPEIIKQYGDETRRLRSELENINEALEKLGEKKK